MLIDIAVAVPPYRVGQERAAEELKKRMADRPAIARLIDSASVHSGIQSRYVVVPDAEDAANQKFYATGIDSMRPGTKVRMDAYEKWAKSLGLEAARTVLNTNAFKPEWIERIITISCTGFFAPGLDAFLMKELRLPPTVRRTHIGFMGCSAALIGFENVSETPRHGNDDTATLLVSVELCSLHLQTEPTRDNILANTIFADGAAAALFSSRPRQKDGLRLAIVRSASLMFDNSSHVMGWKIGDLGFEMILSQDLPAIIRDHAVPALQKILVEFNIRKGEGTHWALHPGGRAILDALETGLGLGQEEMAPSRKVLREYGNMSSASLLFVLKEILRSNSMREGDVCCAVGFGPGLSMEVVILKAV